MGRRLMGRIRLLRDLVLEVGFAVGYWTEKLGIGEGLHGLAAEMERRP